MPLKFKPRFDKIVELLLYLAHRRPGADKYQAVKLFYLADKEHLNRYGRPITFEEYYALKYGPVASKAMDLLEHDKRVLREAGIDKLPFETETVSSPDGSPITYIRKPLRDINRSVFSRSDLRVFDEILERYGDMNFDELYNLTHSHYAYNRAWGERGGSFAAPMRYEDMIDDPERRNVIVDELEPISAFIR